MRLSQKQIMVSSSGRVLRTACRAFILTSVTIKILTFRNRKQLPYLSINFQLTVWVFQFVKEMHIKEAVGMAKRVDSDQTASIGAV